jgi:uncharacterized protein YjbJ (UPF0337 family)
MFAIRRLGNYSTKSLTEEVGTMGSGREQTQGKWDEMKGTAKERVGEVTDDESLEAEGKTDQLKGKGKQAAGKAKDAGKKTKEAIQEAFE